MVTSKNKCWRCCNWRFLKVWISSFLLDNFQEQNILQHLLTRQLRYQLGFMYFKSVWNIRLLYRPYLEPCIYVKSVNFIRPFSLWVMLRTKRRPWYKMAKIDKYLNKVQYFFVTRPCLRLQLLGLGKFLGSLKIITLYR